MRQFVCISFLIACLTSFASAAVESNQVKNQHVTLTSSSASISLAFNARDLEISVNDSDGAPRDAFTLPEEGYTIQKDKPVLPAVTRIVVVSPQAGLELSVQSSTPRIVKAEREPLICTDSDPHLSPASSCSIHGCSDANHHHLEASSFDQDDNGVFPARVAEMSEPFLIRGVRLVRITTYPVQYDAVNREYIFNDNINAEIRYTDEAPVNPSLHPIRRNRSQIFKKFISGLAINGDEVGRDDPDRDLPPAYLGHYLVVTHPSCLQYAQPFIEWRRKQGYKVEILNLSQQAATSGQEARVKAAIQERWDAYVDNDIDPFDFIFLIGDHESYDDVGGGGWIVPSPHGTVCWNGNQGNHFDYSHACMDGQNDLYADVAISRWAAGSRALMELNWGKTRAYEVEPTFGQNGADTAWFSRAAVYGQHWSGSWHITLHTTVRWAVNAFRQLGFTDVRHYEDPDRVESQGEGVGPFITRQLNDGVSMMAGRAENYHYRGGMQGVNDNTKFPIDMDVAGHHEWSCWHMIRAGDGGHLRGPVAATTGWGNLGTGPNNIVWLEMVNGFLLKDLPYGWSRLQGVIAPTTYIPNFYGSFACIPTDIMYYGDPGIQPWIGVPRRVHAEFPQDIAATTRRVDVRVLRDGDDEPVAGADVTLYFPGNMPAADNANYAAYANMQSWTMKSDADGYAKFVFGDDVQFINRTNMYVTVSGRDIKPFLDDVEIGASASGLDVASWVMSEVAGNGDEYINPGERYDLHLTAVNTGTSEALNDVTANVTTGSPFLEFDPVTVSFGNLNPGDEAEGDMRVPVVVRPDCPDGVSRPLLRPVINVEFQSGDRTWLSAIKLEPHAPHLEFRRVVTGSIIPDSIAQIDIEIVNIGSVDAPALTARLSNLGIGVTVIGENVTYPEIRSGETARVEGNRFTLSGNRVVVPGSKTKMMLVLDDNAGFTDTTYFDLQVMEPRALAPQGPDKYGYICFDDTDTNWDIAPEYDWVEIDPRDGEADYEGDQLNFRGQSPNDIGEALVIALPFLTRFYGYEYDSITVATNGYISMGSQRLAVNYNNWPLDRAVGGGVGMIAPYWDRLALGQNGRVYTYYDEEDARFIVEWSRVRHAQGQNDLTFQVIILDKDVWITESGDPNIIIQYKTVSLAAGPDQAWQQDSPFASVGISSPNGDTGISYAWNNSYPVTSAPLQARRALLFSTSPKFRAGTLEGWVTDAATGMPIENAIVFTEHGFIDYSDENGYWQIQNALAEVPFNITCRKIGYNDSTLFDNFVAEDSTLEISFNLLHPEFSISNENLGASLEPGQSIQIPFQLINTGNGPLNWKAEKRLPGNADAPPWALRLEYAVGDTINDDRIQGAVFADNYFYLAGAAGHDSSQIYVVDRDCNLIRQFEQPCHSRYGMRDLDWDGSLLWGSGDTMVYGMTTEGELIASWRVHLNPCNNIAYDTDQGLLWVSGTTTDIYAYDFNGEVVDTLRRKNLRLYGLSYWPEDPDGYNLYITTFVNQETPPRVYKMNTATGDTMMVRSLAMPQGSTGVEGGFITNQYDVYSWVFMTIPNISGALGGDRVFIYQLDARKDWMELDSYEGLLQTGEAHDFTLSLFTAGLPDTLFTGMMRFEHNADDNLMILDVGLNVMGEQDPAPFGLVAPVDGDTIQALPMYDWIMDLPPVTFAWQPTDDPNDLDTVRYRFFMAVGDQSVNLPLISDTTITLAPDTLGLPISFDRPITWWVEAVSGAQVVGSNFPFRLVVIPDDIDKDKFVNPYTFGLNPVWPNPFNGRTTIKFSLEKSAFASLKLYDLSGRVAMNLFEGESKAGLHKVALDGEQLASGLYMLKLESAGKIQIQKLTLIR